MSLGFMQVIDHVVGVPLAMAFRALTPRSRYLGGERPQAPRRVIVSKFVGLGSVVLSLPMLEAMKAEGVRVAFWTFGGQAELLRISGLVDEVWVVKPTAREFLPTLFSTLWRAIRFRADAFIDLEPTANFSALLARMTGAPLRAGFLCGKQARESLFTHLVAITAGRHMVENCLALAYSLGIESAKADPARRAGDEKRGLPSLMELPDPKLGIGAGEGASGRRAVVLNPNTSDLCRELRRWPDAHWVSLCERLLADPSNELFFTGVASESADNEAILQALERKVGPCRDRVHNLAGRTNLKQLLGLLQRAHLAISVDSGVMHLAGWAGTPLIGIFGLENPALYGPRSVASKSIWSALPCSPCCTVATERSSRCQDNQCMKRISPEQVLFASRALHDELAARDRRLKAVVA